MHQGEDKYSEGSKKKRNVCWPTTNSFVVTLLDRLITQLDRFMCVMSLLMTDEHRPLVPSPLLLCQCLHNSAPILPFLPT